METTDSLKRRIATAEDLHSLVRTMKALAAVNVRQLESSVASLAKYTQSIELGLRAVLSRTERPIVMSRVAPQGSVGAIVFGSDQGMCGQLNDQVASTASACLHSLSIPTTKQCLLAVGARLAARLEDRGEKLDASIPTASSVNGITPLVQSTLIQIDKWHADRGITHVRVFYCEHTSRSSYRPRALELLPIDQVWLTQLRRQNWPTRMLPMSTMDSSALFSALVRQYLIVSLYRCCAESMASENASRLAAMRGAERNIGDRIAELTANYHELRQMSITEELLDIASGFEALGVSE